MLALKVDVRPELAAIAPYDRQQSHEFCNGEVNNGGK